MPTLSDVRRVNWYLYPAFSQRYEYTTGGSLLYEGLHESVQASKDDTSWFITKYHYGSAGDNLGKLVYMETLTGAWSGRAALSWSSGGTVQP
jgi:hypothetical protein